MKPSSSVAEGHVIATAQHNTGAATGWIAGRLLAAGEGARHAWSAALEQPRLPSRDLDLRPAAQLDVQPPPDAELDRLHEVEVDELLSIGAKEAPLQPRLERRQRAQDQRLERVPIQPRVIALGRDEPHLAQRHEPAARAVAHEELLERRRLRRRR